MASTTPDAGPCRDVTRAYVRVQGRLVHYRRCGEGPCVILLHDSPRSSRLHLGTMRFLARRFTVVALDTPGYGLSDPLPQPAPSIEDFAAFLGEALLNLGLEKAPVYATHTSAKIALALADAGGQMARLVLDGLSMPETLADEAFIARYMRPFVPDAAGAYLAAEWGRSRDMLRWFPWFETRPENRILMDAPDAAWMADYGIDLFSAGPHYSDAYAAAMRYDPAPALARVQVPALVAARQDDVLHAYLPRAAACGNPMVETQSLPADREQWQEWLLEALGDGVEATIPAPPATARFYAGHRHGLMHLTRSGPEDDQPWLVLSAPTTLQAHAWGAKLALQDGVIVPDLPGFGESDPMPAGAGLSELAIMLSDVIGAMGIGKVRVLGLGLAAPLAAAFAANYPEKAALVAIDGMPPIDGDFDRTLYPPIAFDALAGSHLHRIWHILRDGETQWPWFDHSLDARRRLPPIFDADALHAALTGVLKQPNDWGKATQAMIEGNTSSLWASVKAPLLAFTHVDPAYADASRLARLGAGLAERSDNIATAAQTLTHLAATLMEAS